MTRITTPCQKSDQGDLHGEKVSALEANKGLCQTPATTGRDWPGWSSVLGSLSFPLAGRTLLTALRFRVQALYEMASNLRHFQTASVFPSRGVYCAGNENANPVEPKTLNWKPFPVNLVNKTTSTCLK